MMTYALNGATPNINVRAGDCEEILSKKTFLSSYFCHYHHEQKDDRAADGVNDRRYSGGRTIMRAFNLPAPYQRPQLYCSSQRRHQGRKWTFLLLRVFTAIFLVHQSSLRFVQGRVADDRSQFIYLFNQDARNIIIEYQQDMPIPQHQEDMIELSDTGVSPHVVKDLEAIHSLISEGAEISLQQQQQTDTSRESSLQWYRDRPFFVQPKYPIARIVEYYSPWCGHCQHFASKYIGTAQDILTKLQDKRDKVEFFAVSCSEHHQLCKDEEITGYPTLRAYPAFSNEFVPLKAFTTKIVDETLQLGLLTTSGKTSGISNGIKKHKDGKNSASQDDLEVEEHDGSLRSDTSLDILSAEQDAYHRTRTDVYRDAALSFTHALEHSIFAEHQTVLTVDQTKVLTEWIDLLYWTLPPTWILQMMIAEVKLNIMPSSSDAVGNDGGMNQEEQQHSKEFLLQTVHKLRHVVNDSKSNNWSATCQRHASRHSQNLGAYSCGLWSLFHIMSIGVMERHKAVLGERDRVSTQHAAQTLHDYIQHFFGWCEECQTYFTTMFAKCAFHHCKKFRPYSKPSQRHIPPPPQSWQEFPLWLWRVHNDVNEILLKKETQEQHGRAPTTTELESVQWPSKEDCPLCYTGRGGPSSPKRWDEEKVLKYLKKEYWPGGVQNFRFVVLDKKITHSTEDNGGSILFSKWTLLLMIIAGIGSQTMWQSWKRRRRRYILRGHHHKRF